MLLSWDLTLRPPLLVLPRLLALCRLLSPLLRGTVRRALSLRLLALLRSRRNNTLTAEAHTLLLWLLLMCYCGFHLSSRLIHSKPINFP